MTRTRIRLRRLRVSRGIDAGRVAIGDLQFSPGGLVRDGRYLSLDNFTAVKTDPDAGAYVVIHASKYTLVKAVTSNSGRLWIVKEAFTLD